MPTTLDAEGARLLEYLLRVAPRISMTNLDSFPSYSTVHDALRLEHIGRTLGDSLDLQGMASLALWAFEHNYPAITGMIIDREQKRPGKGYFELYGKDPIEDGGWWLSQVSQSLSFPWENRLALPMPIPLIGTPARTNSVHVPYDRARILREIAQPESRFFLKSEWAPVSAEWPALSFSKPSVGAYLAQNYDPARDFIVYAGTSDPEKTKAAQYRKHLLSVLITEPGQLIPTDQLVPWESRQRAFSDFGKDWSLSFGIRAAWNLSDSPLARDVTPVAYRSLGIRRNWGGVVEVSREESEALLDLKLTWLPLPNRIVVEAAAENRDKLRRIIADPSRNSQLARMESLIKERLGSGRVVRREMPTRSIPVGTNLILMLDAKLRAQHDRCALCGQPIEMTTKKKLLQCSPDRIDSKNPSYGEGNLQITHLACNLAKNDASTEEFEEWLQLAAGAQSTMS